MCWGFPHTAGPSLVEVCCEATCAGFRHLGSCSQSRVYAVQDGCLVCSIGWMFHVVLLCLVCFVLGSRFAVVTITS